MLTAQQIELVVIHLVRDADTLRAAMDRMDDQFFDQREPVELACWRVAAEGYRLTSNVVPEPVFRVQLHARLQPLYAQQALVPQDVEQSLDIIFAFPAEALNFALIAPLLQEFMVSRATHSDMQGLIYGANDYSAVIARMYAALERSVVVPSADPAAGDPRKHLAAALLQMQTNHTRGCPGLHLVTLRRLEAALGGLRGLIGLAGSSTTGKTAVAVQLTREVLEANPDACVVFFSFEMPAVVIIDRLLSLTGEIPNAVLHSGDERFRRQRNRNRHAAGQPALADAPPEVAAAAGGPLQLALGDRYMTRLKSAIETIGVLLPRLRVYDNSWLGGRYDRARLQSAVRQVQRETGASRCLVIIDSLHACTAVMSDGPESQV